MSELRSAARGGVVTLAGAALSAVAGFALNVMMARLLGAGGAGVVLQAVAVFTIALSFAKLGLDTTAVWLLPRLVARDGSRLRAAVIELLVGSAAGALVMTVGWFLAGRLLGSGGAVHAAISATAIFLPAASVMTVALAATRAFGGVLPFNLIGNVLVPLLRPAGLLLVVGLGGGLSDVALTWALPWLVGAVAAGWVLVHQLRRATRLQGGRWVPERRTRSEIWSYSLPRTIMSGLEQAVIWVDVVIVGAMLGAVPAGVYGSAARFVSAGVVVFTAIRIVVAPRFSGLLAVDDRARLEELYAVTGSWILLFGSPVYIVLSVFAPTALAWLGPGFGHGTTAMVVLCLGSLSILAAGNVQALLLMSGHVAWGVLNKVVVVAVNVGLNLALVPRLGIDGAAVSWAVCMVLDSVLAAVQVRHALGIGPGARRLLYVGGGVCATVLVPTLVLERLLGQGTVPLLVATLVSGSLLLGWCWHRRERLHLAGLVPRIGDHGPRPHPRSERAD